MSNADIEDFWLECLNDPAVPKGSRYELGSCSEQCIYHPKKLGVLLCFFLST